MSSNIAKEYKEWQELNEEAKNIRPGISWVGQPKYSIEEMYALRATKGKDPSCDFSIVEGARRSDISIDADGKMIPTSGDGKMPTTEEDWDLWYKLNEGLQTSSPIGLLVEKEKATISEGYLVTRLAELEEEITATAAKLGVTFEPSTGKVQIDSEVQAARGEDVASEIEELATDLGMKKAPAPVAKKVEDEFEEMEIDSEDEETTAATGNEEPPHGREEKEQDPPTPPSVKELANEVMRRPALLREINGIKEELLDRDVKAKKVLEARRDLEVAKDSMDMDAAIYASQKYRMQLEIAAMKIAMLRAIEQGRPHEVDNFKRGIADVYARMSKLENDFALRAEGHQVDLGGAISNLETAQKTLTTAREESKIKRSHLFYSEEGLLKGMGVDVDASGRGVTEMELFDEQGVMVDNVADVLSKSTSYNIEGMVVIRKTSIEQDNDTSDAYYIGDTAVLDVTTDAGDVEISEAQVVNHKIEHGHALDSQDKNDTYQSLGLTRRAGVGTTMMYAATGVQMVKSAAALAALTPEMLNALSEMDLSQTNRGILDSIRQGLYGKDTSVGFDEWLKGAGSEVERLLEKIFVERDVQKTLEQDLDPNPYEEIPFENPNDSDSNN